MYLIGLACSHKTGFNQFSPASKAVLSASVNGALDSRFSMLVIQRLIWAESVVILVWATNLHLHVLRIHLNNYYLDLIGHFL